MDYTELLNKLRILAEISISSAPFVSFFFILQTEHDLAMACAQ